MKKSKKWAENEFFLPFSLQMFAVGRLAVYIGVHQRDNVQGSRAIPAQQVLQETIIQGTSKLPIYMKQHMETTTSALQAQVAELCRWLEKHIKQ